MSIAHTRETLLREVNILPPAYYSDVLGLIDALKTGRQPAIPATMLLSEVVLSKDWDTEEEDEAWASL